MNKSQLLLLGLIIITTACRSAKDAESSAWRREYEAEQARAQEEIIRLREADKMAKARFTERYKRYECSRDSVPRMEESKGPGEYFKSMQFGDHLVLKLKLGVAIHADGTRFGPTRTESRCQLYWDNKLVAAAESLFSLPLSNEEGGESRFFYNPADHTLVVFEDLCWSTQRFHVFERAVKKGRGSEWKVKYFTVPEPPSAQPLPDMGRILGVGNGNIYMEIGSQSYAFPFDDFLLSKLEFTVG